MTTWAKIVNDALVYASGEEFRDVPNWATHEQRCRKAGYSPLEGEPEEREGYTAEPATWHKVTQSEKRDEPRREDPITKEPFMEDVYEKDEETGEMKKVGERQVTRIVPVEFDTSYLQIDSFNYIPIPIPEPVLPRQFSKGDLLEALMGCGLYEQAKAIYAEDLDLQIAWAGFSSIDMDFPAAQSIMAQYPELFSAENVLALQQYIAKHTNN